MFQKSGLELLKNPANVFVQKSAKTNFTPFSHLSALRVSTSLNFYSCTVLSTLFR